MSPILTQKLVLAREKLSQLGLVGSAIQALTERGPEAVYSELSRRGYVWSTDLHRFRKSKRQRKIKTVIVKTGYLDHIEVRLIVRGVELDEAIGEFATAMLNAGYEVTRVSVHTSRNPGELLVYCRIRQNGGSHV